MAAEQEARARPRRTHLGCWASPERLLRGSGDSVWLGQRPLPGRGTWTKAPKEPTPRAGGTDILAARSEAPSTCSPRMPWSWEWSLPRLRRTPRGCSLGPGRGWRERCPVCVQVDMALEAVAAGREREGGPTAWQDGALTPTHFTIYCPHSWPVPGPCSSTTGTPGRCMYSGENFQHCRADSTPPQVSFV